ncbi:MAG: EAL domain-containing protein [Acutalibacteraceae bacterium]
MNNKIFNIRFVEKMNRQIRPSINRIIRSVLALFCIALTFSCAAFAVNAEVNTVYVAGNPDLYPIEYYDCKAKSYAGIMPQIYDRISKNTGIVFEYVNPGLENQQNELAKNSQAAIISAHIWGEIDTVHDGYRLAKINKNGKMLDVCLGFTDAADNQTVSLIKKQLDSVSQEDLLALALVSKPVDESHYIYIFSAVCAALLCTVVILTIMLIIRKRKAKIKEQNMLIDTLTGHGNDKYFANQYSKYVAKDTRGLYYIAYIALELQRIEKYLGTDVASDIQRYAASVLSENGSGSDFSARIGDGVFALAFQSSSDDDAAAHISWILNRLNAYEDSFLGQYRMLFRAGLYHLTTPETPCDTALFNSRQGYNYAAQIKIPYAFSDTAILSHEALKSRLQRKLSDAVNNHEFQMYIQFVVDAKSGKIYGGEALSRWENPEEGLLSPANYIESMKTLGIIDRLDFYILEESCRLLEKWSKTEMCELNLSCNFTRITVSSADFPKRFSEITDRYSFDHSQLIIELTEDSLADNNVRAFQNVLYCQKQGFRIALDDLGSGYSSFSDLCDYPIDIVKIDRHIIAKSVTERGNALLCGITKLAHDLGIKVLCEGVETENENANVIDSDCDYIQGFYYSKVYPKSAAEKYYFDYNQSKNCRLSEHEI